MASSNVALSGIEMVTSWVRLRAAMTAWKERGSDVDMMAMREDEIAKDAWTVPYIISYISRPSFELRRTKELDSG